MKNAPKEFLYIGFYIDILNRIILKIGTTCDLDRRQGEHTRKYKKSPNCTMPADGEFKYLWTLPLSKWNTHRYEELNIDFWKEIGIGEYIRNDRFILNVIPDTVPVKIRKTYNVALNLSDIFFVHFDEKIF